MVNAMCIRSGRQGKYTIVSWGTFNMVPLSAFGRLADELDLGLEGEEHWLEIEVGELPAQGAQGDNLTLLLTSE